MNVIVTCGPKPKRKRRTNAEIEAAEGEARLAALIAQAAEIAAPIVESASRAQKWLAGRAIRRCLNTGAGLGAANVRRPK